MTIEDKQKELDVAKWNKSQSLRMDACGTFNYCTNCNKGLKNPCAVAYGKFFNEELEGVVEEVKVEEKPVVKKTTTRKCATKTTTTKTTTKKSAEKKPATKKTTTKKTASAK